MVATNSVARVVRKMGSTARPARLLVVGSVVVAGALAGSAAIGLGDDGRDQGTPPGPTSNAPAVAPVDADGRAGSEIVSRRTAGAVGELIESQLDATADAGATARLDNGRGGVDPAAGPLPVDPAVAAGSTPAPEVGVIDTDSGVLPAPDAALVVELDALDASTREPLVDQDVPGAPTGGPPGDDLPSDDRDG